MSNYPVTDEESAATIWVNSLYHPPIADYTYEERYVRGTPRPSIPDRDAVCSIKLLLSSTSNIRLLLYFNFLIFKNFIYFL